MPSMASMVAKTVLVFASLTHCDGLRVDFQTTDLEKETDELDEVTRALCGTQFIDSCSKVPAPASGTSDGNVSLVCVNYYGPGADETGAYAQCVAGSVTPGSLGPGITCGAGPITCEGPVKEKCYGKWIEQCDSVKLTNSSGDTSLICPDYYGPGKYADTFAQCVGIGKEGGCSPGTFTCDCGC